MPTSADSRLSVTALSSGYGHLSVIRDVSLTVQPGEAVVLLGANGAGKTTLLRAVAGILPVHTGTVLLGGQDVTHRSVEHRARRGLGMVPEGRALFPRLSVEDNLRIGGWAARGRRDVLPLSEIYERYSVLGHKRAAPAASLSGGQQQLVALVRALRSQPSVLVLDEPSLGLSPRAVEDVMELVGAQVTAGAALLMAEQNVPAALAVATRALVMRDGRVVELDDLTSLRDRNVTKNLLL